MYRTRPGVGYFKPKRSGLTGPAQNQLAVYQNPFSLATNNPKIPDGKCSLSAGQRYQAVESFKQSSDTMTFILYPGLMGGLYVNGTPSTKVLTYNNDCFLDILSENGIGIGPSAGAFQAIAQWRVVSQGMKLSLVNNADENDGWFESVRLTISREGDTWVICPFDSPNSTATKIGASNVVIRPRTAPDEVMGINRSQFVENATYRTGKLRDIHKHSFVLRSESNDHDFVKLNPNHLEVTGNFIYNDPEGTVSTTTASRQFVDNVVDQCMDIVVVIVHGRPGTTTENASEILCHLVANHEMCYEPTSQLSRFHSETHDMTKSIVSAPTLRGKWNQPASKKARSQYRSGRYYKAPFNNYGY